MTNPTNSQTGKTSSISTYAPPAFVLGTCVEDTLIADCVASEIYGIGADDLLIGMCGDDILSGGRSDDMLIGGCGADTFVFDGDFDGDQVKDFDWAIDKLSFVVYDAAQQFWDKSDILSFALEGESGLSITIPNSDELVWLDGVSFEDLSQSDISVTYVAPAADHAATFGGDADNAIDGDCENNEIYGERGTDVLCGHEGDDFLSGGWGNDILFGGEDADTFAFDGDFDSDYIQDFEAGIDKLAFILYAPAQSHWDKSTMLDLASQDEYGVRIALTGSDESVFIKDATLDDLVATEFLFTYIGDAIV
jgi:Ca2+-binding RTX toxin-like protein